MNEVWGRRWLPTVAALALLAMGCSQSSATGAEDVQASPGASDERIASREQGVDAPARGATDTVPELADGESVDIPAGWPDAVPVAAGTVVYATSGPGEESTVAVRVDAEGVDAAADDVVGDLDRSGLSVVEDGRFERFDGYRAEIVASSEDVRVLVTVHADDTSVVVRYDAIA